MTLSETLSKYAIDAITALAPLVIAAFGALIVKATMWIHAHTKNNLVLAMTDRAEVEAKSAVAAGAQTIVADLKDKSTTGKLSLEDAAKIKADVLEQLKANLGGDKWIEKAKTILGVDDIAAFLNTKIEAAVQQLNAPAPVVVVPAVTPPAAK